MSPKRVAIACQGGGSQCAFVAGALRRLFARNIQDRHEIVGLSGTSGGAITAALAWFGLLKVAHGDAVPVEERIMACWRDLTAQSPLEIFIDDLCIQFLRLAESGVLPTFATSPSAPGFRWWAEAIARLVGRPEFTDLRALLTKHLDLSELPKLTHGGSPVLLVGAADVCEGTFKIFSSARDEIRVPALQASAAIPNLFPAVWVDGHAYWDGIFSSNPPVAAFLQKRFMGESAFPQEIWIIQVNRVRHGFVPERASDISDRRNELAGNLSLRHELQLIDIVNMLIERRALTDDFRAHLHLDTTEPITVRFLRMSESLADLDYPSKLSRKPSHIARLVADGETQADAFLAALPAA